MQRANLFLTFTSVLLLSGCSPSGSISLQPTGNPQGESTSGKGKGAVKLDPGELNEVYSVKVKLPPGGHIDVGALNDRLAFKPDNKAHPVDSTSIETKSAVGTAEHIPAFITPEAREILKRRVPAN